MAGSERNAILAARRLKVAFAPEFVAVGPVGRAFLSGSVKDGVEPRVAAFLTFFPPIMSAEEPFFCLSGFS